MCFPFTDVYQTFELKLCQGTEIWHDKDIFQDMEIFQYMEGLV